MNRDVSKRLAIVKASLNRSDAAKHGAAGPMRIVTEKCLVEGREMRKILSINGVLERDKLPAEYLAREPHVYMLSPLSPFRANGRTLVVPFGGAAGIYISPFSYCHVGQTMHEDAFQDMLSYIREAGERLRQVRLEGRKQWQGTETFEI